MRRGGMHLTKCRLKAHSAFCKLMNIKNFFLILTARQAKAKTNLRKKRMEEISANGMETIIVSAEFSDVFFACHATKPLVYDTYYTEP